MVFWNLRQLKCAFNVNDETDAERERALGGPTSFAMRRIPLLHHLYQVLTTRAPCRFHLSRFWRDIDVA